MTYPVTITMAAAAASTTFVPELSTTLVEIIPTMTIIISYVLLPTLTAYSSLLFTRH